MAANNGNIEITKRYRDKYPLLKQKTLARLIFKENPERFKSVEHARTSVRELERTKGAKSRVKKSYADYQVKLTHDTYPSQTRTDQVNARVLVLDIETAPLLANIWGIWNQNINLEAIHSDWFMLTWAAKWLFEKKVYSARVTPKEAIANDDKRIVKSLIEMLNQADVIITHNGGRFDLPRINTRAIIHRIPPPLPYLSIDTLKVAKREFAFTSNKLDYINKMLKLPQKEETNMQLWRDCFVGKEAGLKKMEKYNINDVIIHEQTYLVMRPYIKSHPNMGLHIIDDAEHCPSCGSSDIMNTGKAYQTALNTYETFRCRNCSSIGRRRKANKKSGKVTNSIAR